MLLYPQLEQPRRFVSSRVDWLRALLLEVRLVVALLVVVLWERLAQLEG